MLQANTVRYTDTCNRYDARMKQGFQALNNVFVVQSAVVVHGFISLACVLSYLCVHSCVHLCAYALSFAYAFVRVFCALV
jgi:hypothetical protein